MSISADTVVSEAAVLMGDPDYTQISRARWRVLLNRAQRRMASRIDLYGIQATFDIDAGVNRISLPADCTHLTRVQFTDTPSDPHTYRDLGEQTEDEWKAATYGNYPSGTPVRYCPRMGWFHLEPEPDTTIATGGRMDYWALPPDITDVDTQSLVLPDMARDHLVTGLVIEGLRSIRQFVEARELENEWLTVMEPEVKSRLEDRSSDRRPSFRPVTSRGLARHS